MQSKTKRIFAIALIVTFLASIPIAFAQPTDNGKSDLIKIVYNLRIDVNDAKPPGTPGGGHDNSGGHSGGGSDKGLYTLIANGLESTPVDIYYKPSAEDNGFYDALQASINEYNKYQNIFGNIIEDDTLQIDDNTLDNPVDGRNEITFGDLGDTGIIAQTTTWIYTSSGLIVDFDMVLNTYYDWGYAGATNENTAYSVSFMDTQNILTHEFGHGVGLGDLYKKPAYWQTMYGYGDFGQTWKRTLESGDIAGLTAIYG